MTPQNPNEREMEQDGETSEVTLSMSRRFSGPLPPPELLSKYNEVLPSAAERILAMAEKQQAHRQEMEKKVVFGNSASQTRGNYLGFAVCMTAMLGGFGLIYLGREITGLVAILTPITGLVAVFVYGKHLQRKELEDKNKSFKSSVR